MSVLQPDRMRKLYDIVCAVALINFIAFLIGVAELGGDAVSGKSEGGRYYVANHGKLTEVSRAAFTYSRIHCYAVFTTHALAFVLYLLTQLHKKREKSTRDNTSNV